MKKLKLAIGAVEIARYPEIEAFRRHMEEISAQANAQGVDLLLLPELTCLGLLWTSEAAGQTDVGGVAALYDRVLSPLYPRYRQILSDLAVKNGLTIAGASFWDRDGECRRNSGFLFRPDGSVVRQDKLHPTRPERAIGTSGGEGPAIFEVAGVRMGLAICYDIQFPEIGRWLAESGAEVILVPSLTDERGYWRVRHCAHARAVENQCFVCVSPLIGDLGIPCDRPLRCHGDAYVACPIDNRFAIADGTLARADYDRAGLLYAELDLDLLRLARSKAEIRPLADRRPDLYRSLAARLEQAAPASIEEKPCVRRTS